MRNLLTESRPGPTSSWQSVMLGSLGLTNVPTDLACPSPNLGRSNSSLLVELGDFQGSEDFLNGITCLVPSKAKTHAGLLKLAHRAA